MVRMQEGLEGGEQGAGGSGSLALAKLQVPALVLARLKKRHPKRDSGAQAAKGLRRPLPQAARVTCCLL